MGVALVLVLAFLTLITALVIAFFLSVMSELSGAKSYASGVTVKQLADSAVQAAIAQIRLATSGNSNVAWASQPGMIRTYDNTGGALSYYKLYSSDNMVVSSNLTSFDPAADFDSNWSGKPAIFTDLNSPIRVPTTSGSDSAEFPIVDGNNIKMLTKTRTGITVPAYWGYDRDGDGLPDVEGFGIDPSKVNYDPGALLSATNTAVPMPVKWIYILRDGTLTAPTGVDATGKIANWNSSSKAPSNSNPVIGRIAFWTDDETCKVNINTASDSSYTKVNGASQIATSFTDTPRVCTPFDFKLATCPPLQNEFQRYPGHPATVSLSTVFTKLTSDPSFPENLYPITPRTMQGGSKEATVLSNTSNIALPLRIDRLYTSIDELIFQPTQIGGMRGLNSSLLSGTNVLNRSSLEQARFFITASSRAPDVNLFNRPQVCIWPISSTDDLKHRTAYDRLIALCSTMRNDLPAPYRYYFQRDNYLSQTEWKDIYRNNELLLYLKNHCSRSIPGFNSSGSTFATKYNASNTSGGTEMDQILMEIFDYVRCVNMIDTNSTSNFVQFSPYSAITDNPSGEVVPSYNANNDTKGFGRFATISKVGVVFIAAGSGPVVTTTGTAPEVKQIVDCTVSGGNMIWKYGPSIPNNKVRVQAALLFNFFDPSHGYSGLFPGFNINITKCDIKWSVGNSSQMLFPNATNLNGRGGLTVCAWQTSGYAGTLGYNLMRDSCAQLGSSAKFGQYFVSSVPTAETDIGPYPDFDADGTIGFLGGEMTVQVRKGTTVVQTINFNFPSQNLPVPKVQPTIQIPHSDSIQNDYRCGTNFIDLYTGATQHALGRFDISYAVNPANNDIYRRQMITSKDTMISVQSTSGDLRLSAARATIDASDALFGPHPLYFSGNNMAHSFMEYDGMPYYGATRGQLVQSSTAYYCTSASQNSTLNSPFPGNDYDALSSATALNSGVGKDYKCCLTAEPDGFGTVTSPPASGVMSGTTASWSSGNPAGDWDNGVGLVRDGPYINKADEGTMSDYPYFKVAYNSVSGGRNIRPINAYFSPARQMPSSVMFGSLPTGVIGKRPWQTLLFHPDPTGRHAGSQIPPDHLLLDLFHMPVVEPYAISEPLSTAGRINMNYQIVPFTHMTRETALRAVLKSQLMLSVPNTHSKIRISGVDSSYKQFPLLATDCSTTKNLTLRFSINLEETLRGFSDRFGSTQFARTSSNYTHDLFRSPSEICTMDLVPDDAADANARYGSTMQTYWEKHQLTGDNSRERPYANIYPLLTTKSNTYTVHVWVQVLQKSPRTSAAVWDENKDLMVSEYRGSQIIERYVDTNNPQIPDFANASFANTEDCLNPYYLYRILSAKRFNP